MKYVIIGGSAAGVTCAETIRKYDKKSEIAVVSDEVFPLYSRCLLTYLLAGSITEEKLYFKDRNFYEANNIKFYLCKKAVSIDRAQRKVCLQDKTKLPYEKLLLATGASPKLIDVPGIDKKGVFTLRKIDDARSIMKMLEGVKRVCVLGGGLIGLRDAYALRQRQKEVTVVVKSPQILSQMVDTQAAGLIAQKLEENGIKIMTGVAAKEITGKEFVEEILLDNSERLQCQMVIVGKGVQANTELASSCGLKVEQGIVVDEYLRTSDEGIFAAGDCAQTYDISREQSRINALWPCAIEQGGLAGLNMLGKETAYEGSLSMNSVDFFGLGSISMGITRPKDEQAYEIIAQLKGNNYKKFVLKGNRIVGMVLVGDIRIAGIVCALIRHNSDVSSIKHLLLEEAFDYAKIMPLVAKFEESFTEPEYKDTVMSYQ